MPRRDEHHDSGNAPYDPFLEPRPKQTVTSAMERPGERKVPSSWSWLPRSSGCLAILLMLVGAVFFFLYRPIPEDATPGPDADALAQAMLTASHHDAWLTTGAVQWDFGGRRTHLWDRQRGYVRVRWSDVEVLFDVTTRDGIAIYDGKPASPERTAKLVDDAWAMWINDSFWLNPLDTLFDQGVTRAVVELEDGQRGLLVSYSEGGVTPGDSYLWILNDDGDDLPDAWRMWVKIIPIGGLQAGWTDWQTLDTGARVATAHPVGPVTLRLTDVKAATDVLNLVGEDPFEELAVK